jgi:hypothetical protein
MNLGPFSFFRNLQPENIMLSQITILDHMYHVIISPTIALDVLCILHVFDTQVFLLEPSIVLCNHDALHIS